MLVSEYNILCPLSHVLIDYSLIFMMLSANGSLCMRKYCLLIIGANLNYEHNKKQLQYRVLCDAEFESQRSPCAVTFRFITFSYRSRQI